MGQQTLKHGDNSLIVGAALRDLNTIQMAEYERLTARGIKPQQALDQVKKMQTETPGLVRSK